MSDSDPIRPLLEAFRPLFTTPNQQTTTQGKVRCSDGISWVASSTTIIDLRQKCSQNLRLEFSHHTG